MTTPAYDESYIDNAQNVLAQMMHFAIYNLGLKYDLFTRLFVQSGVAAQFEQGNPRFVAGMSGIELACEIIFRVTGHVPDTEPTAYFDRSEAYWTGFILAWYQWKYGCTFRTLFAEVPCSSIAAMYEKYHELDPAHASEEIHRRRRLSAYAGQLCLKSLRENSGMTQKELAAASQVPLRTIQQYEQGQKDIRKAAFDTVYRLSRALNCRPEECAGW